MNSHINFNPRLTLYFGNILVAVPFIVFAIFSPNDILPSLGIGLFFIAALCVAGFPIRYSRKNNELILYWGALAVRKYDLSNGYVQKEGVGIFINDRQLYWILPGSRDEAKMLELLK